jgi:ATP-binding cassette subfamily C protein
MSELRRVSLRDNDAVSIVSGTADLFIVDTNSQLWPLITVEGPIDLVGPAGGEVDMLVVARIDSELTVLTEREPQLDEWCAALSEQFPADLGGLQPADAQAVRSRLASFSAEKIMARAQNAALQRQKTAEGDRRLINWTKRFVTLSVDRAGAVQLDPGHLMDSDLLQVFRVLGELQGFEVVKPSATRSSNIGPVDAIATASAFRTRKVNLSEGWNKISERPLLGFISSEGGAKQEPVALIPSRGGYQIQRANETKSQPLTDQDLAALGPLAYDAYVPLPRWRPATGRDIARLATHGTASVWFVITGCALAAALLALTTPIVTGTILGVFVPAGASSSVMIVGVLLVVLAICAGLLSLVQNFATARLTQLYQLRAQSALWDRTLDLPLSFFRQYTSGDLSNRLMVVGWLAGLLNSQTVTAILTSVFSLVNLVLLFIYSVPLAIAALAIILILGYAMVRVVIQTTELTREQLDARNASAGWVVQLITGISKVRVAGAEDRFTALTMNILARDINAQTKATLITGKLNALYSGASALAPMVFFIIVGSLMWGTNGATISASTYLAFAIAFGTVVSGLTGLRAAGPEIALIKPALEMIRPILNSIQTQSADAKPLAVISGRIELKDVEFRYQPATPPVLKGLSMTINAGEMTAIVGPSGSGKTSTLRMITGVESPNVGQVLIDGHDLRDIDGFDYRRRIGTVIQGGELTSGTVLENISGGAEVSEERAWRAADAASIGDEIRAMPMQLNSLVTTNTFSGGQSQRILIARALARDPSILLFDEATSALDNDSQQVVMESISKLDLTRVVIAHRLSTVMDADKILVVADGKLVEEGTYSSLMELGGLFAELAKRQLSSS